jgi:hypothetical protein
LAAILSSNAVHISASTVSPPISRRVAEEHARHHQNYVAAPVLGNPDFARERKLFVLAAGPHSALQKVRPLLGRFGQRVFVIGEDAALVNLMKLAANILTATTLECMGEVLALLRKGGLDGHLAYDVLTNSLFDSRVHKTYGGKIIEGRYSPPGMAVPLATEDCGWRWRKPNTRLCRCRPQASSMTGSWRWRRAAGTSSTGRPSVCSPPSMQASTRDAEGVRCKATKEGNSHDRSSQGSRQHGGGGGARRQAVGGTDTALSGAFQHRPGSDPAGDDHGLCHTEKAAANANHAGDGSTTALTG